MTESHSKYRFKIGDYVQIKDPSGNVITIAGTIRKRAELLEPDTAPHFAKVYYIKNDYGNELLAVREEEIALGRQRKFSEEAYW